MPQGILKEVTAHSGSGIQGRENEQRLKHDSEVVPDIEPASVSHLGEQISHADGECSSAPGPSVERTLADLSCQRVHHAGIQSEARCPNLGHGVCGDGGRVGARASDVNCQVDTGFEGAGRDQCHDGNQRFQEHGPVPDRAGVALTGDNFRGDTAGDERVKTTDSPAGNGDEAEWK